MADQHHESGKQHDAGCDGFGHQVARNLGLPGSCVGRRIGRASYKFRFFSGWCRVLRGDISPDQPVDGNSGAQGIQGGFVSAAVIHLGCGSLFWGPDRQVFPVEDP